MEQADLEFYNQNKQIIQCAVACGVINIHAVATYLVAPDAVTKPYTKDKKPAPIIEYMRDLTQEEQDQLCLTIISLSRQIPMMVWRMRRAEKLKALDHFYLTDANCDATDQANIAAYRLALRNWPSIMQTNETIVNLQSDSLSLENALLDDEDEQCGYWPPLPQLTTITL